MPGVPSGRGCEGCRKQKKRCDQLSPSCSRCIRLGIVCIGSGQKRYKFVVQEGPSPSSAPASLVKKRSTSSSDSPSSSIPPSPKNKLNILRKAFIDMIGPATDLRYNMKWTYGAFMDLIPQHLGSNEALDAAAAVMIDAHSSFCLRQKASIACLNRYSVALKTLRECLNDGAKACTPETLCAVMVLLFSQGLMSWWEGNHSSHCEGIAQILKVRGYYDPENDFETKLVLTLRGPVIVEGMFNSNIQFTPEEWNDIAHNPYDGETREGKLMHCLALTPYFINNRTKPEAERVDDTNLLREIRTNYRNLISMLAPLKVEVAKAQAVIGTDIPKSFLHIDVKSHAYLQRTYGLLLTFTVFLNIVLSAVDENEDSRAQFADEAELYSVELLELSRYAGRYKPMGASWVNMCLGAAWVGTNNPALRASIGTALEEFKGIDGEEVTMSKTISAFEWTSRRLRLLNPPPLFSRT